MDLVVLKYYETLLCQKRQTPQVVCAPRNPAVGSRLTYDRSVVISVPAGSNLT